MENMLHVACNAVLAIYFVLAMWRLWDNQKQSTLSTSSIILDTVCHTALILFMFVTLTVMQNNHLDFKISFSAALCALCACLVSLVFGITLGRSWGYTEARGNNSTSQDAAPKSKVDAINERKRVIKSKQPAVEVIDIRRRSPSEDDASAIFETAELAKSSLLTILDVKPNASKKKGDLQHWKLARTGYSSHMWVSTDKNSNILIKGTCFCQSNVASVVKYLFHNGISTGLEGIAGEKETLRSLRRNRVVVSRLTCSMGTFTASKREFLVVTYWAEMENGSVIICSRSLPESYSAPTLVPTEAVGTPTQTHSRSSRRRGYTRGIIHSCGFVIIPTDAANSHTAAMPSQVIGAGPMSNTRGCQVLFSADMDMGGTGLAMRRAHHQKADAIISYVLSLMDQIHSTLPGIDTSALTVIPPAPGTVLDTVMVGGDHDSSAGGAMGLSPEQVQDLKGIAKDCINRLAMLHSSAATAVGDGAKTNTVGGMSHLERKWTTFHDQDGIAISEYCGSDSPVGTLMACCHVNTSPRMVRKLLVEFPEYVDTLLEERSVICQLDERSSIQWIAYGAIWPVGATDFLVITTECSFSAEALPTAMENPLGSHDSFIIASTSVDSVCEDEVEKASNPDGAAVEESKYSRSQLRLAGYTCTPNMKKGGTDVRLFVDVVAATYVPAWLLQMLAQYGLSEMMNRIRMAAPSLASTEMSGVSPMFRPTSSKLDSMLNLIQSREERMRLKFGDDASKLTVPVGTQAAGGDAARKDVISENKHPVSPDISNIEKGKITAQESLRLIQIYLGLVGDKDLVFDWQTKAKKGSIEVRTSPVPGSPWTALKATTFIPHVTKERLRDFLINDSNMGGYDDMMDSIEPVVVVDEKTAIRRIAYKAIWPTAPRDFVVCTTWSELSDLSILITTRSVWDELYAHKQGYVRGFLSISGYHITAIPDGCNLTMCAHSDLGGSVPSGVINMLSSAAPLKVLAAITALTRDS